MTKDGVLIETVDMNKSFTTGGKMVTVLTGVDLKIHDGAFVVIYGNSGSGKSTLLNSLSGLEVPSSGTVYLQGRDIYKMNDDERAFFRAHTSGFMHQQNNWVSGINVLENVALPLYFLGRDKGYANKQAMESLDRIDMAKFAKRNPKDLSGGEQQRVAVARATVNNPAIIFADEPTGNLDSKNGDSLIDLLTYFNMELKRTIILVTHNLEYLSSGSELISVEDGATRHLSGRSMLAVVKQKVIDLQARIDKRSKGLL